MGLLGFVVFRLLEEEVRRQFFVLVASKVRLDDLVSGEPKST